MELRLFDSVSLSGSKVFGPATSSSWRFRELYPSPEGGKSHPQSCARRVNLLRASASSVGKASVSSGTAQSYLSWLTGFNGATSSSLFPGTGRLLDAFDDEYDGVVVDSERLPSSPDAFASLLAASLSHWKMKGKKGVWLKLPVELSELVPVAVKEGFEYHHCERDYVTLSYWIPEGPSMLPDNASHHVGVGGLVINDKNEVLVVQEKYCAPEFTGFWKIPTGFILESEEIHAGAVREVKEETGIDTEFVEVIAFRHAQNMAFDKSDLLFACILKPLSTEIKVDDQEIESAKWMPFAEFVQQPQLQEDSMFKRIIDVFIARLGKQQCALHAHQLVSKFDRRSSTLYHIDVEGREDYNCRGN